MNNLGKLAIIAAFGVLILSQINPATSAFMAFLLILCGGLYILVSQPNKAPKFSKAKKRKKR